MSIQLAAKHLAAHGRGPDTTLVHMTPGEVASLQSLAQQHGGSLTTNPHTGLPEAGFLSALLPMAAGAGLAAMGMPAGYAALAVGATSAATNGGDLRKGLMNGISAYGGAGMAESFMGAGAAATMGTSTAAAPATTLATPPGATSPYALTGSSVTPSTANYSLGESSSYLNQPLPSLVSAAPAEVAQAAAAATPAAQAAQQAASLDTMNMGQRWDALKAGASGTNAMNYIKANPLTSLGVASAMLTPDENKTPQKAADTDRGPRAGLTYHPGWTNPMPKPNMQGVEQPFNRPYYAAKGGVTRMASGGITSAPRNQQQLFADYLQRVSNSGAAANGTTPPTNKYDWWKNPNDPAPAAPAPAETPEQYAARMSLNARGGGGGGLTPEQRQEQDNQLISDYGINPETGQTYTRGEYWNASPETRAAIDAKFAEEHPVKQGIADAVKTLGVPIAYRVFESLKDKFTGPDTSNPKTVGMVFPTEKDRIKAEEAAKYRQSLLGDYSGYEKTPTTAGIGVPVGGPIDYNPQARADETIAANTTYKNLMGVDTGDKAKLERLAKESENAQSGYGESSAGEQNGVKGTYYALGGEQRLTSDVNAGKVNQGDTISFDGKLHTVDVSNGAGGMGATKVSLTPVSDQIQPKAIAQTDAALAGSSPVSPYTSSQFSAGEPAGYTSSQFSAGEPAGYASSQFSAAALPSTPYASGRNSNYSEPTTGFTTPVVGTTTLNRPKLVATEKLAGDKPIGDGSFTPADARTPYGEGEGNRNKSEIAAFIQQQESIAKDYMNSGAVFGFDHPNTTALKEQYDRYNNEINNLYNRVQYTDPTTNDYKTPFVNYTPDIVGVDEISADPNADKTAQELGVPSVNAFNSMYGPALGQYAALNNGVASDAGNSLGYVTPDMGNNRSAMSVPGFGTNVWRSADGTPIRTGDGSSLQTGNAAEAQRQQDAVDRQVLTEAQQNNPDPNPGHDIAGEGGYSNSMTTWGGGGGSEAADGGLSTPYGFQHMAHGGNVHGAMRPPASFFQNGKYNFHPPQMYADGGLPNPYDLGSYSDGGRLLKGPGDGVSDSIPATIGKGRPARLADGEFVIPARIVSEIGNGSTDAGARKLYAMMDRIQAGRKKSVGKGRVAVNSRADKYLPA